MRMRGMVAVNAVVWLMLAAPMGIAQTSATAPSQVSESRRVTPASKDGSPGTPSGAPAMGSAKSSQVSGSRRVTPASKDGSPGTPSGAPAFEVVSVRPSAPGSPWGGVQILPDGYRAWGIGLWVTVQNAYIPTELYTPDRIQGMQPWMTSEKYDIVAKVAAADVAEWQRQNSIKQKKVMMQAMLQAMLAERCKLAVHRIPAEVGGYALVAGKGGPKMKETKTGEVIPSGLPLPDGGVMVGAARGGTIENSFYGASMAELAQHLNGASPGHPVEDRTGLTGKYDFVLKRIDMSEEQNGAVSLNAIPAPNDLWDLGALGLRLEPIKIPSETIVIDHIERPTEN